MSITVPYLSLTLVNERAELCDLYYGGVFAHWSHNLSSIYTNQTLPDISCYPAQVGWDVDATLVIRQGDATVWQMGFFCSIQGENLVTSMQRGYGAISVRLAPWNSRSIPLVVTATIIQTGRTAPTPGVKPDGRKSKTRSTVRRGLTGPDPAKRRS
jgi:hypothetical protein